MTDNDKYELDKIARDLEQELDEIQVLLLDMIQPLELNDDS